ncbi:MarR family winged helix-turn-helix transcriptional regulator [Acidocella sp. KAb 2-4]|uniref:MarR family winged helix-turn-helix transcriptional regulator n=1 Tax=Acidocella sp. KAb 2-4 TaxID=2885158 RepID=UPI001D07E022|nr:MarR family transcriptional regulator [Acidocella sp. KAb 2-4]MCB5944086.1 MarR family transcriptional regulator [Acidocella sp. KAb 2-4]
MPSLPDAQAAVARLEMANRIFFRLYQCANMLHKTGTRAVADEGLTTQQWAVMGALSRPSAAAGMAVNELARYLMVSRQNLAGVLKRMEAAGHIHVVPDARDRRSRIVQMTEAGREVWVNSAQPKIAAYYAQALHEFSLSDMTHALHYLMKLLNNMQQIDAQSGGDGEE